MVEDAFDSLSGASAGERAGTPQPESARQTSVPADGPAGKMPRTERNDYPKFLGAYPWTLDTRPMDEISEEEVSMQIIGTPSSCVSRTRMYTMRRWIR